jgi:hypothetical protein
VLEKLGEGGGRRGVAEILVSARAGDGFGPELTCDFE